MRRGEHEREKEVQLPWQSQRRQEVETNLGFEVYEMFE